MNMTKQPGIGATPIAERSLAAFRDPQYQQAASRQIKLCGLGIVVGVAGIAVALWQLRLGGPTSAQASQFWILCFVLAGGMAGVALVIAGGLLAEQFAINRLAIASTENSEFEAVRETDQLREQLDAITVLLGEFDPRSHSLSNEDIRDLLQLCARHSGMSRREVQTSWYGIEPHWRNLGASQGILDRLKKALFGSIEDHEKDQKYAH